MNRKYFYSSESAHGNSSSHGFSNDTVVRVWETKQARDTYVKETKNITARVILRSEVTGQATNYRMSSNKNQKPNPFQGEFWGIYEDDYSGFDQPGYVGIIDYGTEDSIPGLICRFY